MCHNTFRGTLQERDKEFFSVLMLVKEKMLNVQIQMTNECQMTKRQL